MDVVCKYYRVRELVHDIFAGNVVSAETCLLLLEP